jgi:DNA replication protein DnaC
VTEPGTPTKSPASISNASSQEGPCPICGGFGYLRRDVPPGHPDFGHTVPCTCRLRELEKRRAQDLLQASNLGLLTRMTFDSFAPEGHGLNVTLRDNMRRAFEKGLAYAREPRGWLVLTGGYGCGKTHLAAAIANYQVQQGRTVLFVVVPDLLDHLRATFAPTSSTRFDQRFEAVRSAPLLILDDLGTQSSTSWAQEKLYQILNYRYNAQLPTVITTNVDWEGLDPRLRSRMSELEFATTIHILAPDYRGGAIVEQSELSALHLHNDQTFESFDLREQDPALDAKQRVSLKRTLVITKSFAEKPEGWLVLTGDYGCGKTHLAASIANYRAQNGYSALFISVPDLLDHLRATFDPSSSVGYDRRFSEIRNAPLLVLDDFGTHNATPWAQEKLFQILDHRYSTRLPTVITMNRDVDLDPRIKSRLLDVSRCQVWEITVPSFRGGAGLTSDSKPQRGMPAGRGRRGTGIPR